MLYNVKYRVWSKINDWWAKKKPVCKHWFRVISPSTNGRREIEVSECFWCKTLTSELYIKGKKWAKHYRDIEGYGPVEACPITEDPPEVVERDDTIIILPNRDLYYERSQPVAVPDRNARKSKKAPRKARRIKMSRIGR